MRAPAFMKGVAPKPSTPAHFMRQSVGGGSAPAPTPAAPAPSPVTPPLAPAPVSFETPDAPAAPAGGPAALAEFRPPPSPPPPPRPSAPSEAALAHALEKLGLQNERLAELARSDALEIGFMVAERILEQEITTNPRAMISLVRSAMRRLADSRNITVALSPADHERVKSAGDAGLAHVKLEIDPSLEAGDCRVSSELGVVDGKLESRLAEVRRAIDASEDD